MGRSVIGVIHVQDGDVVALSVEGAASVRGVREAHGLMLVALRDERPVAVDLGAASSVDAAFLQLLASARSAFAAAGVEFRVTDPAGLVVGAFSRR